MKKTTHLFHFYYTKGMFEKKKMMFQLDVTQSVTVRFEWVVSAQTAYT